MVDDRQLIPCRHWSDCGVIGGGCCSIGEYDRPSFGVCLQVCTTYDGPSRGAGDLLAKAIKTATLGKVTPCGGCNGRQRLLNRAMPFGDPQQQLGPPKTAVATPQAEHVQRERDEVHRDGNGHQEDPPVKHPKR